MESLIIVTAFLWAVVIMIYITTSYVMLVSSVEILYRFGITKNRLKMDSMLAKYRILLTKIEDISERYGIANYRDCFNSVVVMMLYIKVVSRHDGINLGNIGSIWWYCKKCSKLDSILTQYMICEICEKGIMIFHRMDCRCSKQYEIFWASQLIGHYELNCLGHLQKKSLKFVLKGTNSISLR